MGERAGAGKAAGRLREVQRRIRKSIGENFLIFDFVKNTSEFYSQNCIFCKKSAENEIFAYSTFKIMLTRAAPGAKITS